MCVSGGQGIMLTCIFACSCVSAAVGVCLRVFTSVFMCAGRDCKFTGRNVDVCGPHITPDKLIKM